MPAQPSPRPLPPRCTNRCPDTRRSTNTSVAPIEAASGLVADEDTTPSMDGNAARGAAPGAKGAPSEQRGRRPRRSDVRAAELGDDPAARRPLEEPELEQVRLPDLLDSLPTPAPGA